MGDEEGKDCRCFDQKLRRYYRFQGGPNAGHTLEFEGIKHVLHNSVRYISRECYQCNWKRCCNRPCGIQKRIGQLGQVQF